MQSDLAAFLARHKMCVEDSTVWGDLPLCVMSYLSDEPPPLKYVTSVRGLVFQDGSILAVRNRDGIHILPGGRCQRAETPKETLHRELLEETGWTIAEAFMLGFMHFHHLAPKPADYQYPHPDFLQLIYMAEVDQFMPEAKHVDDYEIESRFHSLDKAKRLNLSPGERLFLDAAEAQSMKCMM